MSRFALASVLLLGLTLDLIAQLQSGDIGVTGFSTNSFGVMTPSGTVTGYTIAGAFAGTGTTQAILWDPNNPSSFIVGGVGFTGRVTITGPGAATYSTISNATGQVGQLSWDGAGRIVDADTTTDQVLLIDPATGAITNVTSGPQPWGSTVNAGAFDPRTGDIYVGNHNSILRLPAGTTTPVLFAGGWTTGTAYVSWVTFDPFTGEVVATLLSVSRVVRISAAGTLTDLCAPGAVPSPNAIDFDANGDFLVGSTAGKVYRVPNAGGTPFLLGTNTFPASNVSGISVVRPNQFRIVVASLGGGAGTVDVQNIPAGSGEGWTFLSLDTSLPVGAGPVLGVSPDATTLLIATLFPFATPGNPFHWTWATPPPLYFPGVPFVIPTGTMPFGLAVDFLALAIDQNFTSFQATTPVRVTF